MSFTGSHKEAKNHAVVGKHIRCDSDLCKIKSAHNRQYDSKLVIKSNSDWNASKRCTATVNSFNSTTSSSFNSLDTVIHRLQPSYRLIPTSSSMSPLNQGISVSSNQLSNNISKSFTENILTSQARLSKVSNQCHASCRCKFNHNRLLHKKGSLANKQYLSNSSECVSTQDFKKISQHASQSSIYSSTTSNSHSESYSSSFSNSSSSLTNSLTSHTASNSYALTNSSNSTFSSSDSLVQSDNDNFLNQSNMNYESPTSVTASDLIKLPISAKVAMDLTDKHEQLSREQSVNKSGISTCCQCCRWHMAPEPIVLLACGSFNPITNLHLRIMELARDAVERTFSFQPPTSLKGEQFDRNALDENEYANQFHDTPSRIIHTAPPRRQMVVAGIFSPVSDAYEKSGLAPFDSRCQLARLACASTSDWLAVDTWEGKQPNWLNTRTVFDHFQRRLDNLAKLSAPEILNLKKNNISSDTLPVTQSTDNIQRMESNVSHSFSLPEKIDGSTTCESKSLNGMATDAWLCKRLLETKDVSVCPSSLFPHRPVRLCSCSKEFIKSENDTCSSYQNCACYQCVPENGIPKARVKFVCGADLLQSFATPGLWSEDDMTVLARDYGIICISRPHSDAARLLFEMDLLSRYEHNIILVTEWCQNGLSATLVRRALARGLSVRYLVPDAALEEIYAAGLYGAKRRLGKLGEQKCEKDTPQDEKNAKKSEIIRSNSLDKLTVLNKDGGSSILNRKHNVNLVPLPHEHVFLKKEQRSPETDDDVNLTFQSILNKETPICIKERSKKDKLPRHVKLKNHSVQTRLSSIPNAHAPIVLRRVIIDPGIATIAKRQNSSSWKENNSALTAILPLVKQCSKCGSHRVRLLLIERPPVLKDDYVFKTSKYSDPDKSQLQHQNKKSHFICVSESKKTLSEHENQHPATRRQTPSILRPSLVEAHPNQRQYEVRDLTGVKGSSSMKSCLYHTTKACNSHFKTNRNGGITSSERTELIDNYREKSLPRNVIQHHSGSFRKIVKAHDFEKEMAPSSPEYNFRNITTNQPQLRRYNGKKIYKNVANIQSTESRRISNNTDALSSFNSTTIRPINYHCRKQSQAVDSAISGEQKSHKNDTHLIEHLSAQTAAPLRPQLLTRHGRTYDEVDLLLHNLCLNIESAL